MSDFANRDSLWPRSEGALFWFPAILFLRDITRLVGVGRGKRCTNETARLGESATLDRRLLAFRPWHRYICNTANDNIVIAERRPIEGLREDYWPRGFAFLTCSLRFAGQFIAISRAKTSLFLFQDKWIRFAPFSQWTKEVATMSVYLLLSAVTDFFRWRSPAYKADIDGFAFKAHYKLTAALLIGCSILVTANNLIGTSYVWIIIFFYSEF